MENLGFGLWVTAIGMGTVFLLLLLLTLTLSTIGRLDQRSRRRRAQASAGGPETSRVEPAADGLTDDEIAAVTIAVITHARVRRLEAAPAMRAHEPGSHLFANRWVGIGRGFQQQPWTRGN